MKLTREQARNLSGGGNTYFKLEPGQSAMVRFLFNTLDDMIPEACHSVKGPNRQWPTDILCARESQDSPLSDCKYCAEGHNVVARYIIPMYNEDAKEIQYWVRSGNFEKKLAAHTEDFNGKQPISGQIFKMVRTGTGTNTDYELISQGANDGKTVEQFGEIKGNDELKMLKPGNYEFPADNGQQQGGFGNQGGFGQQQFGGNQGGFGGQQFNSTRRTTNMF